MNDFETIVTLAAEAGWYVQRASAKENGGRERVSLIWHADAKRRRIVRAFHLYPDAPEVGYDASVADGPAIPVEKILAEIAAYGKTRR